MPITVTPFLRNVLLLDAVATGATAVLALAGASLLGPLLGIPSGLLFWAGVALVPFVAMVFAVSRRQTVSRAMLVEIIAINVLWVVASFGLLVSGAISPNLLGIAFVSAQAVAVALFAELQYVGLRRQPA
ncbi:MULTISPECIES: hypothetical protein [Phyllobacteriaceae]|jgi:hypothetical protein|uniref:Uncharacterized protein n=2 Tax=Pseudomonadota TaxID=1224 RepID=A0A1C2DK41_9HYPH|nr:MULTISPECIES: hypothetical protein [Mesorhizobium]MBN9233115.1 hypothetical protein [Mesorhizobium sp.]MDQ0332199.1 hypothetical protein [Mesorhizobium sp. YL-MeA3-2017]OCX15151.1 hypothetical protein QV13_20115 [Mesorhizobium hungaricum]